MANNDQTKLDAFVTPRVHELYWKKNLNCATTSLLIMEEYFNTQLQSQLLDAALGMHGAGGYRAQCGLVEGMLLFIGVIGREKQLKDDSIVDFCKEFATKYEKQFSSLACRDLRPNGFRKDDPPHLCEDLTIKSIIHTIKLIETWLQKHHL